MKRDTKFFAIASAVIALAVVLGMIVLSSGVLSLIFDPEPESYYLLRIVGP